MSLLTELRASSIQSQSIFCLHRKIKRLDISLRVYVAQRSGSLRRPYNGIQKEHISLEDSLQLLPSICSMEDHVVQL